MASTANPTLLDRFLTFINPYHPAGRSVVGPFAGALPALGPTDCVLLAVSGGLDSVVMAHLFQNAGLRFAIAHANFRLRGDESDDDALFVENVAKRYRVPFHLTQFQTDHFACETGVSTQMAARTLRYDWFEQLRDQNKYAWIATAHHRHDVLETLLLNLTRGTGLAGLHGIAAWQGHIIRPLLFADRTDLETYAIGHQLDWREDRSNADDHYARNRIRHHVVPVLQGINPNLLHTLTATIDRLRAAQTLAQHELDRTAEIVLNAAGATTQIDLVSLRTLTEPAFRLAEWLRPFGFTYQQTTAMWQAIGQGRGQEFRSGTHRLIHEQDGLTLTPILATTAPDSDLVLVTEVPDYQLSISPTHRLIFQIFDKPVDFMPPADPLIASFDADQLTLPLTIRRWQSGDRFRPLGLNGQKLVSDLLADQKVPRLEREQIRVLLAGDRIAWVIGKRLDHRFRTTALTRRIVQVQQAEM
ncbi:MAG: tRNA lysidine(34) synthetase TilS [Bacteroidetes bacterium]|nr:tRNA lysidine(34) synthetase TilS [Fibrella sp.]